MNPASFFISLRKGNIHKTTNMESNPQLELARDFLEHTGVSVFLTGKAGTGKTTFLRQLKERSPKRMIVVAPTGVAAIYAGGVTIHSFFQLPFGPHIPGTAPQPTPDGTNRHNHKFSREKINIIRTIDLLVIDEISMVRADLLDAVDEVLRRYRDHDKAFGGVQLLMIGDLQQLAPVVKEDEWKLLKNHYESAYFFHSKALAATRFIAIELKHVYRQQDGQFISLLNHIRQGHIDASVLAALNKRHLSGFNPPDEEGYITLTTHNKQADRINELKMALLSTRAFSYKAEIKGDFPAYSYPTDETLTLKKGAQVMFVKNDSSPEKRYYNGKIGIVTLLDDDHIEVTGKEDNVRIRVGREEWTNTKYTLDETTGDIQESEEGTFRQFPLKTAWAITIHKSQGLTFERIIVDANAAFAHGQVYVALSRCKTFEGLVLSSPLTAKALINDDSVERFIEDIEQNEPGQDFLREARQQYFRELLLEQFDFLPLKRRFLYLHRLYSEQLRQLYPELIERRKAEATRMDAELWDVSTRFRQQLEKLMAPGKVWENDPFIAERTTKGAAYFSERTQDIFQPLLAEGLPEIDNKEVRKQMEQALENLKKEILVKLETLQAVRQAFNVTGYLQAKAKAQIEKQQSGKKTKSTTTKTTVSSDIRHPQLYARLRTWRNREAERLKLPVYAILQQKALLGVANTLPTSSRELLAIPGIGPKIVERYGAALLELVDEYRLSR